MNTDGDPPIELRCESCGAEFNPVTDANLTNCPHCGELGLAWHAEGTVRMRAVLSHSYAVVPSNEVAAKRREMELAVEALEKAEIARDAAEAQGAAKASLAALHELEDARKCRSEWSQGSWTCDQIELWNAHIPVRNAAHHFSDPVIELRSGTDEPTTLCWNVAQATLDQLRDQTHVPVYLRHLAGQDAVASLRAILAALPH